GEPPRRIVRRRGGRGNPRLRLFRNGGVAFDCEKPGFSLNCHAGIEMEGTLTLQKPGLWPALEIRDDTLSGRRSFGSFPFPICQSYTSADPPSRRFSPGGLLDP